MTAASGRSGGRIAAAVFSLVAFGTLVADLVTKWLVHRTLRRGDSLTMIPGLVELHVTDNPGAAFSMGAGRTTLLILFSVIACVVILWAAWRYGRTSQTLLVALGLLLGGALGNLWDRVLHDGKVRDFIHLHLGDLVSWPGIFNVADVAIVAGCVVIVWRSFSTPPRPARSRPKRKRSGRPPP